MNVQNYIEKSQELTDGASENLSQDFYQLIDSRAEEIVNSWYGQSNFPIIDVQLEYSSENNQTQTIAKFKQTRFQMNYDRNIVNDTDKYF